MRSAEQAEVERQETGLAQVPIEGETVLLNGFGRGVGVGIG